MKKMIALLLLVTVLCSCTVSSALEYRSKTLTFQEFPDRLRDETVKVHRDFAYKTAKDFFTGDNETYSPMSLFLALSMITEGAEGKTFEELKDYLGFTGGKDTLKALVQETQEKLSMKSNGQIISFSNSLWTQVGFPYKKTFADIITTSFYGDLFEVPFNNETKEKMKAWVSEKTDGMIKPALSIQKDTLMVLMNTTLFKGAWGLEFDDSETKNLPFHSLDGAVKEVPMMHSFRKARYFETGDFKGASIMFQNKCNMHFITAKEGNALDGALEALQGLKSEDYLMVDLDLTLPKVKIESEYHLADVLKEKTPTVFSENADFSGISDKKLMVSNVIQETKLETNEKGAVAAGVTILEKNGGSAPRSEIVELKLDKPFLFSIESDQGVVLFIGSFVK
ncbi:serpin family protein [Guggenheimella bovis]